MEAGTDTHTITEEARRKEQKRVRMKYWDHIRSVACITMLFMKTFMIIFVSVGSIKRGWESGEKDVFNYKAPQVLV